MLSPFVCCRKRRPDLQLMQQVQMVHPIQVHQPKGDFSTFYQCLMAIMTYEQVEDKSSLRKRLFKRRVTHIDTSSSSSTSVSHKHGPVLPANFVSGCLHDQPASASHRACTGLNCLLGCLCTHFILFVDS